MSDGTQGGGGEGESEHPAQRVRILVPDSRSAYLVPDPSGQLIEGECFLQPTIADVPTVIKGRIMMVGHGGSARNPCYHKGDIRVLQATVVSRTS
eukprot:1159936-Pelagomonas_calceolata.AAC.15